MAARSVRKTPLDQNQQSRIRELIVKGKEQGYLTYAEVNDHLPDGMVDTDQVEEIIATINDMGITVHEAAPDADTLILSCLLYTSPSPRDGLLSRMPSSA